MTREDDLITDQRRRRQGEIEAAARRYVRDCAHAGTVLDISEWGERRWRRDGQAKRRIMIDALADEVRRGIAVVNVWRRYEVPGAIARQLIGATSYGDLYRILKDNGMEPGFRPADVAVSASEGRMTPSLVAEIFGLDAGEVDAFIAAWLASSAPRT